MRGNLSICRNVSPCPMKPIHCQASDICQSLNCGFFFLANEIKQAGKVYEKAPYILKNKHVYIVNKGNLKSDKEIEKRSRDFFFHNFFIHPALQISLFTNFKLNLPLF